MRRLLLLCALLGAACSDGGDGDLPTPCVATKDCSAGEVCDRAACVKPAPKLCAADLDCGPGNACLQSVCVGGTACRAQGDCGSGERCDTLAGVCVVPACGPKGECPNDGFCDPAAGRCSRARACLNDGQCAAPGGICVDGACVAGCGKAGCADGLSCDAATGRCGAAQGCTTDAQCDPPDRICASNRCVPGCLAVGCNLDETCDASTGRCRPAGCASSCAAWEVCGSTGACDPRTCDTDAQCGAPLGRCEMNVCIAGCGTSGCGAGADCDGATGECVQVAGELDASCSNNAQCGSSFCLTPGTSEPLPGRCAVSCGTTSDCEAGRRCTEPDATPGVKACLSAAFGAAVGPKVRGDACAASAPEQCQSGLCVTNGAPSGFCFDECSRDAHCRNGEACRAVLTDATANTFVQLCAAPDPGALDVFPSPCGPSCRSGLCDDYGEYCFSPCCRSTDCGEGSVCLAMLPVATDGTTQSSTLLKGCAPAVAHGTAPVGAACSVRTNCRSNLCVSTRADGSEGPGYCSDSCCSDADCGAGFVCAAGFDEGSGYSYAVCLRR